MELRATDTTTGWQYQRIDLSEYLTPADLVALGVIPTPITPPPPPPALWTDRRADMPYNPHPDDPWLAARCRSDWWGRQPADIQRITVHHIGSTATAAQVAAYITRPVAQGGKGLPRTQYHYHITPDGEILYILDLSRAPWHDSGGDHNTGVSIGLSGALHTHKPPIAQLAAAARLVAWLMDEYAIPLAQVNGHDEWARHFGAAGTTCPGWTAANWRTDFFTALGELTAALSFAVAEDVNLGVEFDDLMGR